jgi:hypothetical protein
MRDYKSILVKWLALNESDEEIRKKLLGFLHEEVKKGFDVLTRIAIQELERTIGDKVYLDKVKDTLEMLLAFSAYGGYMLYLVENNLDPEKLALNKKEETNKLGAEWVQNYDKDQCKSLLLTIDPIISMFMEKGKQGRMNHLFLLFPDSMKLPYKDMAQIDTFLNWIAHQGYIFGILENNLSKK